MSLLSRFMSFFKGSTTVNREFSTVYRANEENSAEEEVVDTADGTYDMYQSDNPATELSVEGTMTGTAEDISAVLEVQSRRYSRELTI